MYLIPVPSATDYFEITVPIVNDVWTFVFTWNESYNLFHADLTLNGTPIVYSIAVLGGVFALPNWTYGYNFFFYGTIGNPPAISDLGTGLNLYQMTLAQAQANGFQPS